MSLHRHLRAVTADAHAGLERDLDWQARVATLSGYRDLLGRLYGFHAVYEPAIAEALADAEFWDPRRRLSALSADLTHLGWPAATLAALPRPRPVLFRSTAAAMGALYVLEGSTLGGQVIGRHIGGLHGLDAGGLAYYRAHGRRTGLMWNAFRARLDGLPAEAGAAGDAADAAIAAFEAMRIWLCAETGEPETRRVARSVQRSPASMDAVGLRRGAR